MSSQSCTCTTTSCPSPEARGNSKSHQRPLLSSLAHHQPIVSVGVCHVIHRSTELEIRIAYCLRSYTIIQTFEWGAKTKRKVRSFKHVTVFGAALVNGAFFQCHANSNIPRSFAFYIYYLLPGSRTRSPYRCTPIVLQNLEPNATGVQIRLENFPTIDVCLRKPAKPCAALPG